MTLHESNWQKFLDGPRMRSLIRVDLLHALDFFGLYQWDLQIKGSTRAELTLHPNFASMALCNRPDNRQPQTGAALYQRFSICTAIELFKQARLVIFWNADTTILNCKR